MSQLKKEDNEIFKIINSEFDRQTNFLELIASENFTSKAVLEATGSVLTNKYAEGYPGKRYYGGCIHVDEAENLAIHRAKELFKAEYANVQPHSGSSANMGVFLAMLNPGDCIMGLDLSHGGHLTHGSKVSFSGKLYNAITFHVKKNDGLIDFDDLLKKARKHKPKIIICGASAYPRTVEFEKFREIADEVGAFLHGDICHNSGLIAAEMHPSPFPYCHVVSTSTHKTLRGPRGGLILARANEEIEKKLNAAIFPGIQGGPLMHVIAAKAVAFKEALGEDFKAYQTQVVINAQAMAKTFISRGYDVVSGGTDDHLFLVSFISQGLTGKAVDAALGSAHITVNKNAVPNDPQSPFITSGIRVGTPAATTRGFGESDCRDLATRICDICDDIENPTVIDEVRAKVEAICAGHPVYK